MHANIRSPLDMARATLVKHAAETPLAARQHIWAQLMAARGQTVHLDRLAPLAHAAAQVMPPPPRRKNAVLADREDGRAARISDAVRQHCEETGHTYHGPTGGDAA